MRCGRLPLFFLYFFFPFGSYPNVPPPFLSLHLSDCLERLELPSSWLELLLPLRAQPPVQSLSPEKDLLLLH